MVDLENAIMYGGVPPYELVEERLCEKYHKLPHEIREMDVEDMLILIKILEIDSNKEKLEHNRAKLKRHA